MSYQLRLGRTDRVFVLTGAGISAESGIRTFRDAGGLWENHRVEEVASPQGFQRDPALVWRFYSERRKQAQDCLPNAGHLSLAALEKDLGARMFLCTQNVDPLHERAGSAGVVHMHGELFKSRFDEPGAVPFEDANLYYEPNDIPRSSSGARLRPHICWFGEVPFAMEEISEALQACTVFITIGSSGSVYPAAGFVSAVRKRRRGLGQRVRSVYVCPERPENGFDFDEICLGLAGDVLPTLFDVER